LSARKIAVGVGLASTVRTGWSRITPAMPTGIVPKMIIHASFCSVCRNSKRPVPGAGRATWPSELKKPRMIRSQSRQK